MAEKFWTHLKLKNGDQVKFVPPAPDGDRLGGITQAEREAIGASKHLLSYDGTSIKDGDTVLTHADIYNMLMNTPAFVVLVYQDHAYHPNTVDSDQIIFIASNVSGGYEEMDRITILSNNTVTLTFGKAEMVANKTTVINDTNKNNDIKYPSLKAVADYVSNSIVNKQDKLVAGNGIQIAADGKTISATGTGTVKTVNGVQPNAAGDVLLTDATLPAAAIDVEARNDVASLKDDLLQLAETGEYQTGGGTHTIDRVLTAGQIQTNGAVTNSANTAHFFATDINDSTRIEFDDTTYKINAYYEKNGSPVSYTTWIASSPYLPNKYSFDRIGINVRRVDNVAIPASELPSIITTVDAEPTSYVGNLATKDYVDSKMSGSKCIYPDGFDSRIKPEIYKNGSYYTSVNPADYKITGDGVVYVSTSGSDSNNGTENSPYLTIEKAVANGAATIILKAGTYVYGTHFAKYLNASGRNLIGEGLVTLNFAGEYPLYTDNAYVENVVFLNGGIGSCVCQSADAKTICFVDCAFRGSANHGLTVKGFDTICINCDASDNQLDGYNYHAFNDRIPNVLEINCTAHDNASNNNSCNGSTSHDGTKIIRVNGEYYNCHGGVIADMGIADGVSGWSINYGVLARDSTIRQGEYPSENDYTAASFWASTNCNMYLYDCKSSGSVYDLSASSAKIVSFYLVTGRDEAANYNSNGNIVLH